MNYEKGLFEYSGNITCDLRDMPLKGVHCINSMGKVDFHILNKCVGPLYIRKWTIFLKT